MGGASIDHPRQMDNCRGSSGKTQADEPLGGPAESALRGPDEHLIGGREADVPLGRLRGAVGRRVAAHHVGGRMTEQMLDVQLADIVLDRPCREGVPEAVGVHLRDPRAAAQPPEEVLEAVDLQPLARPERAVEPAPHEQRPWGVAAVPQVGGQRGPAAAREGDHALLLPFALSDVQAPRGEVAVVTVEGDTLRAADAGVEQRQDQGDVPAAGRGVGEAGAAVWVRQASRRARTSCGVNGCTTFWGSRTLRRPRKGSWSP